MNPRKRTDRDVDFAQEVWENVIPLIEETEQTIQDIIDIIGSKDLTKLSVATLIEYLQILYQAAEADDTTVSQLAQINALIAAIEAELVSRLPALEAELATLEAIENPTADELAAIAALTEQIDWIKDNLVEAEETYTLTLNVNLTGAGADADDAITALTVDGVEGTYDDGVWTVEVEQGKLSYAVAITTEAGYTLGTITVATASAGVASASAVTAADDQNFTATLNVIDDAELNLNVSYNAAGVAAAKLAAAREEAKQELDDFVAQLDDIDVPADNYGGSYVGKNGQDTWMSQLINGNGGGTVGDALNTAKGAIDAETNIANMDNQVLVGKIQICFNMSQALLNNLTRLVGGNATNPNLQGGGTITGAYPAAVYNPVNVATQGSAKYWNDGIPAAWVEAWNAINEATVDAGNTGVTVDCDAWLTTMVDAYTEACEVIIPVITAQLLKSITLTDGTSGSANVFNVDADGKVTVDNAVAKIVTGSPSDETEAKIEIAGATVNSISYNYVDAMNGSNTSLDLNVDTATVYVAYTLNSVKYVIEIEVTREAAE